LYQSFSLFLTAGGSAEPAEESANLQLLASALHLCAKQAQSEAEEEAFITEGFELYIKASELAPDNMKLKAFVAMFADEGSGEDEGQVGKDDAADDSADVDDAE
jgi:hypothetical protein